MSKINIIAICGKAGSGKDWLLHELLKKYPEDLNPIISTTTRPKREGEKDSVDYHFVSEEMFKTLIYENMMLEATSFNGWYYGTCYEELSTEKTNIGVFNPDGIRALLEDSRLNVVTIRVSADDKIRLIRQLNREENPYVDEIIRRYTTDKKDFLAIDFEFDYIFYNSWCGIQDTVDNLASYLEDRYLLGQKCLN